MSARTPRDADTRENTSRTVTWKPPSTLPDPNPEPGYRFRWIRASTNGQKDDTNMSVRLREGWEPVRREDHPELMLGGNSKAEGSDNVEVGGLILCKTAVENVEARNAYYGDMARKQEEAADNNPMQELDRRMPVVHESRKRVSFGRGSRQD